MNMKILKFIALLLILAGSLASCKDKADNSGDTLIEIPLKKYSLEEASCQWTNLNYNASVIIVNSVEELNKYVICTAGSYPAIDFSKYTLLLTGGGTTNGVSNIDAVFTQVAVNQYSLKVTIHLNLTTVAQGWSISVLTPKIAGKSTITSTIQQTFN